MIRRVFAAAWMATLVIWALAAIAVRADIHAGGRVVPAPAWTPAHEMFEGLVVAPEYGCQGYDRDRWGHDAEVQRPKLLERDGGLYQPLYGDFQPTADHKPQGLQVEHVVAMKEAADSGLCRASRDVVRAFAKDLGNQVMALGSLNASKGAKDAAEWRPDVNGCEFARIVIDVKQRHGLSVDHDEAKALAKLLASC